MSLDTNLGNVMTRISTESKALRTLVNGNAADLSSLTTTTKTNLVAALKELKSAITVLGSPAVINDSATNGTQTWSGTKINQTVTDAISALTTGAPGALNTLDELAAAIGDDANFAATVTTALANRLRVDTAAQGLTTQQKSNARANIDVYSTTEIGSVTTDYVAIFEAGLV